MLELSNKYNEVFTPANASIEQTYLEGVENCVCKNLYSVLFGDNGVGSHQNQQQVPYQDQNLPTPAIQVSEAHLKETEQNKKISENIARFGDFILPRHLEIDESRLVQEYVERACH